MWITRSDVNRVITVKRLDGDYDSTKHISLVIANSLYNPEDIIFIVWFSVMMSVTCFICVL